MKEYGVVYSSLTLGTENKYKWLEYCQIPSLLPKDLKLKIDEMVSSINEKYSDNLYVKLGSGICDGCICDPECVSDIAKDLFEKTCMLYKEFIKQDDCVKLVYTTGDMLEEIESEDSIHRVESYPVMIKIGRFLDNLRKPGIFKI